MVRASPAVGGFVVKQRAACAHDRSRFVCRHEQTDFVLRVRHRAFAFYGNAQRRGVARDRHVPAALRARAPGFAFAVVFDRAAILLCLRPGKARR